MPVKEDIFNKYLQENSLGQYSSNADSRYRLSGNAPKSFDQQENQLYELAYKAYNDPSFNYANELSKYNFSPEKVASLDNLMKQRNSLNRDLTQEEQALLNKSLSTSQLPDSYGYDLAQAKNKYTTNNTVDYQGFIKNEVDPLRQKLYGEDYANAIRLYGSDAVNKAFGVYNLLNPNTNGNPEASAGSYLGTAYRPTQANTHLLDIAKNIAEKGDSYLKEILTPNQKNLEGNGSDPFGNQARAKVMQDMVNSGDFSALGTTDFNAITRGAIDTTQRNLVEQRDLRQAGKREFTAQDAQAIRDAQSKLPSFKESKLNTYINQAQKFNGMNADELFEQIKTGKLRADSVDPVWRAMYINGSATPDQIEAHRKWKEYDYAMITNQTYQATADLINKAYADTEYTNTETNPYSTNELSNSVDKVVDFSPSITMSTTNGESVDMRNADAITLYNNLVLNNPETKRMQDEAVLLKNQIIEIEEQEALLYNDIKKQVKGEASQGLINALASKRAGELYPKKQALISKLNLLQTQVTQEKQANVDYLNVILKDQEARYTRAKDQFDLARDLKKDELDYKVKLNNLLSSIPKGETIEIDGAIYEGVGDDKQVTSIIQTDRDGTQYIIGYDKNTGQILYKNPTGIKERVGGSGGGGGGGTSYKYVYDTVPQRNEEGKVIAEDEYVYKIDKATGMRVGSAPSAYFDQYGESSFGIVSEYSKLMTQNPIEPKRKASWTDWNGESDKEFQQRQDEYNKALLNQAIQNVTGK